MWMFLTATLFVQACGGCKGVAETAKYCFIFLIYKGCPQQLSASLTGSFSAWSISWAVGTYKEPIPGNQRGWVTYAKNQ